MRILLPSLSVGVLFVLAPFCAPAQDNVTIPKSRLEELERKEKELQQLKSGAKEASPSAPVPTAAPASAVAAPAAAPASAAPAIPPAQPKPLSNLPPYESGQKVSSAELVAQFLADPAGAEQRYRKKTIVVEGRVIRIAKQWLRRDYELILEGPQAGQEVVCRLRAPDQFEAIYTINSGAELVGTAHGVQTPLAKVGTTAVVRGKCKGLKGAQVRVTAE